MIDYQMHTVNSDGTSTVEEMIGAAEKIGLKEICITDHFSPRGDSHQLTYAKLPKYFKQVESASKDCSIIVRIGVEIEYYERCQGEIEKALSELDWDFVLGSTHYIGRLDISYDKFYYGRSQLEAYRVYFEKWGKAVESGLFDVMAHPDYLRRWAVPFYRGELEFETYQNMLIEPLRYIAKNRIGFEVNCGGLRRGEGMTYPSAEFVHLAHRQGVQIVTISSDAHGAEDLSVVFLNEGLDVLKRAGFSQVYTFRRRKLSPIPIHTL